MTTAIQERHTRLQAQVEQTKHNLAELQQQLKALDQEINNATLVSPLSQARALARHSKPPSSANNKQETLLAIAAG